MNSLSVRIRALQNFSSLAPEGATTRADAGTRTGLRGRQELGIVINYSVAVHAAWVLAVTSHSNQRARSRNASLRATATMAFLRPTRGSERSKQSTSPWSWP